MDDRCLFFGCWNTPGHYLVGPGGHSPVLPTDEAYELCRRLDSCYAPRVGSGGSVCWLAAAPDREVDRSGFWRVYNAAECPQGQFMRHRYGRWTLIQWWDRCQGDTRGACNSTVLLEGEHTTEEMLAALAQHFPHVLENLKRHGVELVEVKANG